MPSLAKQILGVLEAQGNNMASVMYVLDRLEREEVQFSMAEFDDTVEQLRKDGVIRVKNSAAPRNNWQLQRQ
jgi:DNA invertase Pin-like site-specific DNA recombinase